MWFWLVSLWPAPCQLANQLSYQGFPTRMVYLHYISCLRYTTLAANPQYYTCLILTIDLLHLAQKQTNQIIKPSFLLSQSFCYVVYLTYCYHSLWHTFSIWKNNVCHTDPQSNTSMCQIWGLMLHCVTHKTKLNCFMLILHIIQCSLLHAILHIVQYSLLHAVLHIIQCSLLHAILHIIQCSLLHAILHVI